MLQFVVYVGVIIVCAVVAVIYLYPGSKKVTTVPGLDASDEFEGNVPEIEKAGSLHSFLILLHHNYGKIASFWFGHQLVVSIASPALFKQHAKVFDRPPILFKMLERFIGTNSIQFCNGDEARERHKSYGRCFKDQALTTYYDTFRKLSDELVQKWRKVPQEEHIGVWKEAAAVAIKSMLQCSFGKRFDNDSAINRMRLSYEVVMAGMESRPDGSRPEKGSVEEQMFNEHNDIFHGMLTNVLEDYRNNPSPDATTILVDVLSESGMPETTITSDMVTVFTGGFHTTAMLMTWSIFLLAKHQDVQRKLFNEIQHILASDEPGDSLKVTPENIDKLVYLRQVLDETLRWSVIAPFAARCQDVESELGGHLIPAGTPVIHALGVVFQDPDLYPDPTKFDPDRFSAEKTKDRLAFAFEPFGFAGKRKCLGWKFSIVETTVVLATIVGRFNLSIVPGQDVVPDYGFVTKPSEEIWITAMKRD